MIAYQLKNRLKFLQLTGYEDGEYIWLGDDKQWRQTEETDKEFEEGVIHTFSS